MDGRGAEPAPAAVANFKSEQMNVALSAQAMTAAAAPSQGCFRLFSLIVETLLVILGQGGGRKEGRWQGWKASMAITGSITK